MHRLSVDEFRKAEKMPLIVVLDDVRSLYNVGSVFRTADAFRVEAIYLCGITATPDEVRSDDGTLLRDCTMKASQEIHKTALGAEESVAWRYFTSAKTAVESLKNEGYEVLAVEQCHGSTMLGDFNPNVNDNLNLNDNPNLKPQTSNKSTPLSSAMRSKAYIRMSSICVMVVLRYRSMAPSTLLMYQ